MREIKVEITRAVDTVWHNTSKYTLNELNHISNLPSCIDLYQKWRLLPDMKGYYFSKGSHNSEILSEFSCTIIRDEITRIMVYLEDGEVIAWEPEQEFEICKAFLILNFDEEREYKRTYVASGLEAKYMFTQQMKPIDIQIEL